MIKKILLTLLILPMFMQAQTISGTFAPAENYKWFIIYKLEPTRQKYIGNGKFSDGKMEYTFSPSAEKGMYRLVYGLPQESENFDFIYDGNEDIVFSFDEGMVAFTSSKENQLYASYFSSVNTIKSQINTFYQNGEADEKIFMDIFKALEKTQNTFEKEAKGTVVHHFIKANRTYLPSSYETPEVMMANIKKHYFDAIDFSDPVLQNSDFIAEKVSNYVFTALPMREFTAEELFEEFKKNVATVIANIQSVSPDYQKTLLSILWQQMVALENQEIANYIADTYLIELATQENDRELVDRLQKYKRLSYGEIAPEITWVKDNKTHALSELDSAENYIIVFWSSTCSHCLAELPLLKDFVSTQEKGKLQVIAIGLEDERDNWAKEIATYPDFIHILGLEKWENEIGNTYAVNSTPTFFILDKDKRIIGKPYGVKELKEFYTEE